MIFELSQESLKSVLDYYPETGEFLWREKPELRHYDVGWNKCFAGKRAGCNSGRYQAIRLPDGKLYRSHRLAWLYIHGWLPDIIDHINRDRMDNRIANLRPADKLTNGANRGPNRNCRSGVKGVSWSEQRQKWEWSVKRGDVRIRGRSATLEEAKAAHDKAAYDLYGEYAPTMLAPVMDSRGAKVSANEA